MLLYLYSSKFTVTYNTMRPFSNRQLLVFAIVINLIILLLLVTALLVRFLGNREDYSENMVTNQQLWQRPIGVFIRSYSITAQLNYNAALINSPPVFDAYTITPEDFINISKTIVIRNFTVNSLSGLQPNTFKYHNYFFIEGTQIEASACFSYLGSDGHENASYFFMYVIKSEEVFNDMKPSLHTGSCNGLARDVCDVVLLKLNKNCESIEAVRTTIYVKGTKKDHYIFAFFYRNTEADKTSQSSETSLWVTYVIQRPMYDVKYFGKPLAIETSNLIDLRSRIVLLDFPWLLDKQYGEVYNIELSFIPEPNNEIYLAVFSWIGILLIVFCILCFALYIRRCVHQRGYEPLPSNGNF